jgi:hypothetical protein
MGDVDGRRGAVEGTVTGRATRQLTDRPTHVGRGGPLLSMGAARCRNRGTAGGHQPTQFALLVAFSATPVTVEMALKYDCPLLTRHKASGLVS